ncbi:MAG: penicillin-binding transpeptidase domain-containing protein [Bryobacteraceae bacterium]
MIRRRELPAVLLASYSGAGSRTPANLDRFFDSPKGAAVLVDVHSRQVIGIRASRTAGRFLVPPGSTIKPFVLAALLRTGRLRPVEAMACPGALTIQGRSFACSHPKLDVPVRIETALAYSCNCYVASAAERFAPGELTQELVRAGFATATGLVGPGEVSGRVDLVSSRDAIRIQALGEQAIVVTAAEMAYAYRTLALNASRPDLQPIVAGLEGAVEFGTAQRAGIARVRVAGKTGSVRTESGARIAWFAGFLPSRAPEVAISVMLQGRSGGSDAAPVAGRILSEWRVGKL